MAILAAVVLLVGEGVNRLERRLLRWKPARGGGDNKEFS